MHARRLSKSQTRCTHYTVFTWRNPSSNVPHARIPLPYDYKNSCHDFVRLVTNSECWNYWLALFNNVSDIRIMFCCRLTLGPRVYKVYLVFFQTPPGCFSAPYMQLFAEGVHTKQFVEGESQKSLENVSETNNVLLKNQSESLSGLSIRANIV